MEQLHSLVNFLNAPLWNLLIYLLLGVGIYFTLRTLFVQVRLFKYSLKEMFSSRNKHTHYGITPFQAFVTGIASRVGVGNIAGVAIAVSLGGAGAVFWMWITALIGMSSAFAESSLGQLFKVRDKDTKQFRGGPAYYISQGLGQKWLGILFALALILAFGFVFNAVQANTIVAASKQAWGADKYILGFILVAISAPIIFGGIKRVSKIAEIIVPIMALGYIILALIIVALNWQAVPGVFARIFTEAFQYDAAAGGLLGGIVSQAMMLGIKRGLFSNEAGMGSAPNAAAAAAVKHPASQGLIQMLGVFVDTVIVCSATAFILLLSNVANTTNLEGVQLTQAAIGSQIGTWGIDLLAVMIFLFAFSSIIGNYAYAESNVQFIKNDKKTLVVFRLLVLAMVFFGAVNKVPLVWDMADLSMGIMAVINLIAILLLSPLVFIVLKDYTAQLKAGKDPEFDLSKYPELNKKVDANIWDKTKN